MTPLVAAAVLLAAVGHAAWNALAHHLRDQLVTFTLISGGGAVIGAATALLVPFPAAGAWPWLLLSAAVHVAYMALLMRSFTLGDFGQVYPIARGTAPLVVTGLAAVFLHEVPDGRRLVGVAVASAGLLGLALWGVRRAGRRPQWGALFAAGGTGLTIAVYSVVDGVGVRASGSPIGYVAWLMLVQGPVIPAYALYRHRGALAGRLRPHLRLGLLGAALSVASYGLVLWAQTRAPLAPVAALRESSVIVGAVIGTVVFKERFGAPRVAAAGLMAVGIALMLHGV
ncbi:EamA family transporter [Streptomyces kanasensis]|uniref:EamA family transporter n=1 Tax=Streptomyces kanasensis TaxID=936756 RepID=UPI0036FE3C41